MPKQTGNDWEDLRIQIAFIFAEAETNGWQKTKAVDQIIAILSRQSQAHQQDLKEFAEEIRLGADKHFPIEEKFKSIKNCYKILSFILREALKKRGIK